MSIVVNEEYATRNNHSSLMVVRERLGNTFICSSDNYFVENPFEPYVWKAYYAAQYQEGPTNEWCMRLGSGNRIVSVDIGGSDSLIMLGHVYFDKNFSRAFSRILEEEYDLPHQNGGNCITIYHRETLEKEGHGALFYIDCYPGVWAEDDRPVMAGASRAGTPRQRTSRSLSVPQRGRVQ